MHADAAIRNPIGGSAGPADAPLTYSVPNAAKMLDIGVRKMWELVSTGRIESIKIDTSRRIPRAALVAYVESLRDAEEGSHPTGPTTPTPPTGPGKDSTGGCAL